MFAAVWLRTLEHLTAAIPALSPREEHWLEEESGTSSGGSGLTEVDPDPWPLDAAIPFLARSRPKTGIVVMLREIRT